MLWLVRFAFSKEEEDEEEEDGQSVKIVFTFACITCSYVVRQWLSVVGASSNYSRHA